MQKIIFMLGLMLIIWRVPGMGATWQVDKAHSQVNFTATHMTIAEVQGTFREYDVNFSSEKDDFTDGTIEATIKTFSISTGNEKRDGHLKSDDFFNAEKFPEMRFKSTSIVKTGDGRYAISGELTIRDVTKSVVLDTEYKGTITDPWGGTRAGFKASATVNRFDFNLKWDAVLETGGWIVGKDIGITLLMQFIRK